MKFKLKELFSKHFSFILQCIFILACTMFMTYFMSPPSFHHPHFSQLSAFDLMPLLPTAAIILLTCTCGYFHALVAFTLTFIYRTAVDADFAYSLAEQLMAATLAHHMTKHKWFKDSYKTFVAVIVFTLCFGDLWAIVLEVINGKGIQGITFYKLAYNFVFCLPFSTTLVATITILLNFLPDKIKYQFPMSRLYTAEYRNVKIDSSYKDSKLSTSITTFIVLACIVLSVAAPLFANILLLKMNLIDLPVFNPQTNEVIFHSTTLSFDIKLLLLMLNVTIPIGVSINYIAQKFIATPIRSMSEFMLLFGSYSDEERQSCADRIKDIKVSTHDEIADLYNTLRTMIGQINQYISRLKKDQELKLELAEAKAQNEAKSTFLSNMSHEIRTPINAVLGLDEMIIRESSEQAIVGYATEIKNAGRSLLSIINDILDFSKIEAGKLDIIPVQYELSSAINDLVNMISIKAKDKNLDFKIDISPDIPHLLYGDEIRIKQIILNILTNAVKYTKEGSVTFTVGFSRLDEEYIALNVSVADTGIGIKEEDLAKLATPFQRIEEKRNRTIEGTGLGMSIVKMLLTLMGSSINVQSEYGKGSTFSFSLRQKVVNWEPMGSFAEMFEKYRLEAEKYAESFHAPEAKILVVDDTPLNLTVVKGLLKQTQIQIDTALSGLQTLELVTKKRYDIIFIDQRMPGMDGIETLHALEEMENNLSKDAPCIALTANAIAGARDMFINEGFDNYLSKPVDGAKLERMIRHYLPPELVHITTKTGGEAQAEEEPLPLAEGIDFAVALGNCGSRSVLLDALRAFYIAIDGKAASIAHYAEQKDYKNYTVLVHALKSSARLIGAMKLSDDARYLEERGDEENESEIAAKTPALLDLYRSYKEKLAAFAPEEHEAKPPISQEQLSEALAALKDFVEAFDFDSADNIMTQLDGYAMPEDFDASYRRIKELIAAVDREALLKLLNTKGKA